MGKLDANEPVTPSPLPLSTSASTSRLRKRSSAARSITSVGLARGGSKTVSATPDAGPGSKIEALSGTEPSLHIQRSYQSLGRNSLLFNTGPDTNRSSWLHRKSTLSSLKSGSPATLERPASASLSYSNGSTAPMLPDFPEMSPSPTPRNKLVKRSSSQRALQGSDGTYSTLRRPATSHQRYATIQRQFQAEEESAQRPMSSSRTLQKDDADISELRRDSRQVWRPFFRSQPLRLGRSVTSRKRNVRGGVNREDNFKCIVPDITELPTLVMATSISTRASDDEIDRTSNASALSRPFTPLGLEAAETPASRRTATPISVEPGSRPRSSFSLSEMFPTPSPLTWKMPRTGSLRNKKSFSQTGGGHRVSSAPQINRSRRLTGPSRSNPSGDPTWQSRYPLNSQSNQFGLESPDQRPPSSPLPPLNRLSAFEVDLPSTIPSYPTSPRPDDLITPSRNFSSFSSPSMSSQVRSLNRDTSHRPSGAPSDLTSTLHESDNDNSRLFSGDEDEMDGRSDTVYDSTRTGATGASLSGLKRPPIDTIFDESQSSEDSDIQEHVQSETRPGAKSEFDQNTPGALSATLTPRSSVGKEKESFSEQNQSPSLPVVPVTPLPASAQSTFPPANQPRQSIEPSQDDDEQFWIFNDHDDDTQRNQEPSSVSLLHGVMSSSRQLSQSDKSTPKRRQSPPNVAYDRSSKAHLFDWSEHIDKENSPGGSPRPKTVDGRQANDLRGGRFNARRGPNALHLRSQSVPVPDDYRSHSSTSKLDSWALGNKGPSEDWDGDFDFEEPLVSERQAGPSNENMRTNSTSGMLVPRAILDRQASVHGQFGQVKELTLLVVELRRLQKRASELGIIGGQSIELWKEAEGIIDLATIEEDEHDPFAPRSPNSPSAVDFDMLNEDSPLSRTRQRSGFSPPRDERASVTDDQISQPSSRPSQDFSKAETPPIGPRPRKDSSAKAKSVLDHIHSERSQHDPVFVEAKKSQKKLPFDTTSLKDLVTRAGVVTRALKEVVRRAEGGPSTPAPQPTTPRDPPLSQLFQQPTPSPPPAKTPSITQSPKSPRSPKSTRSNPFMGASIASNDNEINGHMKIMTVV